MIPIKDNIPNDRFPIATVAAILANVVIYLVAVGHGGSLWSGPAGPGLAGYAAIAHAVTAKTAILSLFLNLSLVQLAGNLLFLWIFGNTVEDAVGPVVFVVLYVAGGLAALGLTLALDPGAGTVAPCAAGAIATLIGGYIVLYARARVLTLVLIIFFFGVIEVPALVMLALWFVMQAAFGNGLEAYLGQLAGFALGAASIRLLATRRKPTPPTAAAYR